MHYPVLEARRVTNLCEVSHYLEKAPTRCVKDTKTNDIWTKNVQKGPKKAAIFDKRNVKQVIIATGVGTFSGHCETL